MRGDGGGKRGKEDEVSGWGEGGDRERGGEREEDKECDSHMGGSLPMAMPHMMPDRRPGMMALG